MSSKELYIGNIEPKTKPEELKELFQIYGTVNRSEVIIGSISTKKIIFKYKYIISY